MSWTDTIPVLSDEMIEDFELNALPGERRELELWFKTKEVINPQPHTKHLVTMSIDGSIGKTNTDATPDAGTSGSSSPIDSRTGYWKQFIEPITGTVPTLLKERQDVTFRVYLAPNLDFLAADLSAAGCEIHLMEHFSTEHSLGKLWKYLAFAENNRFVTTLDSSQFQDVVLNLTRTETLAGMEPACWREPRCIDIDKDGLVIYAPMQGSGLGVRGGWPILPLICSFIWHSKRGGITNMVSISGLNPKPMKDCLWHEPNCEEWFLAVAFYPRAAAEGILTLVPTRTHSSLLLLDIEYATWSSPLSELMIYPTKPCCGYSQPEATAPPEILAGRS